MIEITFKGDTALAEIQAFAAQIGVGAKMLNLAREQAARQAEQPKDGEIIEPPKAEDPKPAPKKAGRPPKTAAPVVENVANEPEDVFDETPAAEDESQDAPAAIPADLGALKDFFLKCPLSPNKQIEIVKKYSTTGKLSGIAEADYGKVVAECNAAVKAANK